MKKKIFLATLATLCVGSTAIGLAACQSTSPTKTHTHTPGEWVNTDPSQHYKLCTDSDCDNPTEKIDASVHENGPDKDCSVCGYKAEADNPPEGNHHWGAWTVTEVNKPTKIKPGKATRTCTDKDCNVEDTEFVELPPLASTLEYTITDDTANCTEGGTATYTYKENTAIGFTAETEAKGHEYGEAAIVDGVPVATCASCGNQLPAELRGNITPSNSKATFFAGGELEYTLIAYPGAQGYYIFTYEGEKQIQIEYTYATMKDGEISGTVTLSGSGRTSIITYLETKATCIMKITSAEETAFVGEISLDFSERDPSYVTPELSLGLTTVNATYEGTIYEFTAPISGSYVLSCDSEKAVIIPDGTVEALELPYTFTLEKDAKISFAMCSDEGATEYDVQVKLELPGSGTYSDPYVITEDMLAVNIGATLKNGETKYYKLDLQGDYLLNCLPLEAQGSCPEFVHDSYTAESYTAEITILEEKIIVTGWQVPHMVCGENGLIFALTGSGETATDNVRLYVNHVYGSEQNPATWLWYYFYYDTGKTFEIGDTYYIDFLARVTGRIDVEMLNLSSVKLDGTTLSTDGASFKMEVTEGEHYLLECVISSDATGTYYISTDVKTQVTTVSRYGDFAGTKFNSGSVLIWFNHCVGMEMNPYKLNDGTEDFETYANDDTYANVNQSGYYTFTFSGLTATLNDETAIVSGTKYKLVADDVIKFVNEGEAATVTVEFEASVGDITNPLLISELENGTFTVESGATYYVKADGNSDIVLTFSGVTVTCNDSSVTSGTQFNINDGDIITVVNEGEAAVTVNYATYAVLGSVNNPETLTVDTAQDVDKDTYFSLTLTGEKKFTIAISGVTPLTVNGLNYANMAVLPDVTYPLYAAIIEIDNKKYVFDSDGVLRSYIGNEYGLNVGYDGDKKSAFIATDDSKVLELAAGTYLLHVIKNPGLLAVLGTLPIDCTLTVTEKQAPVTPPVTIEGSGTSAEPFVLIEPGTFSGETTANDEEEYALLGGPVHYYTYTATGKGTLTFTGTNTIIVVSKTSFADLENLGHYVYPGDTESCSLNVEAGDTVYMFVENADGIAGEYNFNIVFAAE